MTQQRISALGGVGVLDDFLQSMDRPRFSGLSEAKQTEWLGWFEGAGAPKLEEFRRATSGDEVPLPTDLDSPPPREDPRPRQEATRQRPQRQPAHPDDDPRTAHTKARPRELLATVLDPGQELGLELARGSLVSEPTAILQMQERAQRAGHLIGPGLTTEIPTGYGVAPRAIAFKATDEAAFYKVNARGDEYQLALTRHAIDLIAATVGVKIPSDGVRRVDDRSNPFLAEYSVTAKVRSLDGSWQEATASKEFDLRDGSPRVKKAIASYERSPAGKKYPLKAGEVPNQITEQRVHVAALAETGARLRAIRALLGLRAYKPHEAERPFFLFALVFQPDMTDAGVRQAVTLAELGLAGALNPGREPEPPRAAPAALPAHVLDAAEED